MIGASILVVLVLYFWLVFPKQWNRERRNREYCEKYYITYFMFDSEEDGDIIDLLRKMPAPEVYLARLIMVNTGQFDRSYPVENTSILSYRINSIDDVKCIKVEFERDLFDKEIELVESWPRGTKDEHMKKLIRKDAAYIKEMEAA